MSQLQKTTSRYSWRLFHFVGSDEFKATICLSAYWKLFIVFLSSYFLGQTSKKVWTSSKISFNRDNLKNAINASASIAVLNKVHRYHYSSTWYIKMPSCEVISQGACRCWGQTMSLHSEGNTSISFSESSPPPPSSSPGHIIIQSLTNIAFPVGEKSFSSFCHLDCNHLSLVR